MEPLGKKGIFVGYSESSKAYRVYILGFRKIETRRYVTFDEDATFSRSKMNHTYEVNDEVPKAPRETGTNAKNHGLEDHDMAEP